MALCDFDRVVCAGGVIHARARSEYVHVDICATSADVACQVPGVCGRRLRADEAAKSIAERAVAHTQASGKRHVLKNLGYEVEERRGQIMAKDCKLARTIAQHDVAVVILSLETHDCRLRRLDFEISPRLELLACFRAVSRGKLQSLEPVRRGNDHKGQAFHHTVAAGKFLHIVCNQRAELGLVARVYAHAATALRRHRRGGHLSVTPPHGFPLFLVHHPHHRLAHARK